MPPAAESDKKKCECHCPCGPADGAVSIQAPFVLDGPASERPPGAVEPIVDVATSLDQVRVTGNVRVEGQGRSSNERTIAPGLPGADVFAVPGEMYLGAIDATTTWESLLGGTWVGRPGGGTHKQPGTGSAPPVWSPFAGAAASGAPRPERGAKGDEGRSVGPVGQYHGIKRTEEQDKRIRTETSISEAERATIAKKAALSPGGKAAVSSAKGAHARLDTEGQARQYGLSQRREQAQSELASAGVSTDLPHGPGASASDLLVVRDPADQDAMFGGEFDVGGQKGTEAFAQAGRAAAARVRQEGKEELQARRSMEERAKRLMGSAAVTGGSEPASPAANTIQASQVSDAERQVGSQGQQAIAPASNSMRTIRASSPSTREATPAGAPARTHAGTMQRTIAATPLTAGPRLAEAGASPAGPHTTRMGGNAAGDAFRASVATPDARWTPVDIASLGTRGEDVMPGSGRVDGAPESEARVDAVATMGAGGLQSTLLSLADLQRPGRGGTDFAAVAAADLVAHHAYSPASALTGGWRSALQDEIGGASGAPSALGVVRGRDADTAIAAIRGWMRSQATDVHVGQGGVDVGYDVDPKAYARARASLVNSMTASIRASLIAAWKAAGKPGPKPTSDDARDIALGLIEHAERGAGNVGGLPDAVGGDYEPSAAADPCAEERKRCRETCGCDCECTMDPSGRPETDMPAGRGSLTYLSDDPIRSAQWRSASVPVTLADGDGHRARDPIAPKAGIWAGFGPTHTVPPNRGDHHGDGPDLGLSPQGTDPENPNLNQDRIDETFGAELRLDDLHAGIDWPHLRHHGGAPPPWNELTQLEQHFLLLLLAKWMYADPAIIERNLHPYFEFIPLEDHEGLLPESAEDWGLCAGLFRYRAKGGPGVLAFKGTEEFWPDLVPDDVAQHLGIPISTQYERASRLAKRLHGRFQYVTGHSLGGGLAQFAAYITGANAVTLNPAPLSLATLMQANRHRAEFEVSRQRLAPRIVNYSVAGDPVSDLAARIPLPYVLFTGVGPIPMVNQPMLVGEVRRIPRERESPLIPPPRVTRFIPLVRVFGFPVPRPTDAARWVLSGASVVDDLMDRHSASEGLQEFARAVGAGIGYVWRAPTDTRYRW